MLYTSVGINYLAWGLEEKKKKGAKSENKLISHTDENKRDMTFTNHDIAIRNIGQSRNKKKITSTGDSP